MTKKENTISSKNNWIFVFIIWILVCIIWYLLYDKFIKKDVYFDETLKCANMYLSDFCDESCDNVWISYSPEKRTCIWYYTLSLPISQRMVYEIKDLIWWLESEYEYEYATEWCNYESDFLWDDWFKKDTCYYMWLDEISWLKWEKNKPNRK
jgi:hypothetical protein